MFHTENLFKSGGISSPIYLPEVQHYVSSPELRPAFFHDTEISINKVYFSILPTHTLSLRVSRCALWLSLLEKSSDNWNILSIACQRGQKLPVIYNNRPSKWCFYPCHLGLKLLTTFLLFLYTEFKSVIRTWTVFDAISSLLTTKVVIKKKKQGVAASGLNGVFIM